MVITLIITLNLKLVAFYILKMCIISGPVSSVGSTKILCLPSKNRKRQLTVYKNAVNTPNTNAMCLPVPNPNTVKFEKVPKDIFTQCSNSFDYSISYRPQAAGVVSLKSKSYLAIQSHGSYDVVLVPSMSDIKRIPPSFLILTDEVKEFLQTSYPGNFGIVLCKLKAGRTDYEPFAYSHELQDNLHLFFPTKHFHINSGNNTNVDFGEPLSSQSGWGNYFSFTPQGIPDRRMPALVSTRFADDWDHEIYSAGTPTSCHESRLKYLDTKNQIMWNDMPSDFQLDSSVVLRCKEIIGYEKNLDIEMPVVF